jgi:hypothetical protein
VVDHRPYTAEAYSTGLLGALFILIAINRDRLMPMALLQLRPTTTLFQKYGINVTLVIALLSLVMSVIQVIQGFTKP